MLSDMGSPVSTVTTEGPVRRATSWQPVTPPRAGVALRPASAQEAVKRRRQEDEEEARRVKMFSKRDGAKLRKEYEHARDPSLVEVVLDQRCTRCSRNQWRCFIEADPHSPRRVCRPCGKNRCSFGNAKARPEVNLGQDGAVKQEFAKQETSSLDPPYMPYQVSWEGYRVQPVSAGPPMERKVDVDYMHSPSERSYDRETRPPLGSHRFSISSQSSSSSSSLPALESPPSPSAHIYRRGSAYTLFSAPRTPPEPQWRQPERESYFEQVRQAKPEPLYGRQPDVLETIRELMATTRDAMSRLADLEAEVQRSC